MIYFLKYPMMKKILLFLVAVLSCASFYSCNDNDEDNTNVVRYQVSISDPTVRAGFTGIGNGPISIYDGWEYEEETDADKLDIWVSTSEEEVIVTLKVYVNNKLKFVKQNKRAVYAYIVIRE